MGRGLGSGGSGIGSGVGAGGAGSGPGPGGRGSGGTWYMTDRYPWALNANGAPARSAPFTEEEGLARLPESGGHPSDATRRLFPKVLAAQTNANPTLP